MANSSHEVIDVDDIDAPVPASELQELNEEKRILSSVYRHVEHQQAVEQVAGVAGVVTAERALSNGTNESQSPSSPWITSLTHRTPSLPVSTSTVGSEESGSMSGGIHMRLSGAESTEAGDIAPRTDTLEELLALTPSLDSALRLNMNLQRRFREKIIKLENVFKRNLERQAVLREAMSDAKVIRDQDQRSDGTGKIPLRISHFCVPYFKNRSGMPAPMNDDAKMKVKTGYIDLYVTRTRTWLTVEKETLDEAVRKEWKEQSINNTELKIRELQRKLRNVGPEGDESEVKGLELTIHEYQEQVKRLTKASLNDTVPKRGESTLDWDKIAAQAFDGHRTQEECKLQWENFLHPDVNTLPWTENEDLVIQRIILNSRVKIPEWERIANELRTNRTPFQVMQRYVSFIEPTMKPKRWSKKDTDKLLHTVNMLRVGHHIPWAQVHQHLVGFSRAQVQSRWRMVDPDVHKGPFTVEEDFILIKGLHMFGLNFAYITHFMPGRNLAQVRERYKRTILPGLSVRPWKQQEDDILIKECSVGSKNWRKMIMKLPRFDACQIRCRYHTIQVWQTISKTTMVPPPLFPLTTTVIPSEVQEIRKALIMEASNVKQLIDSSRKTISSKGVVKELEERRQIIKERKTAKNLTKIKKVTEKRGRQPGTPNPHYTPVQNIFLTEFFIPYRHYPSYPSLSFDSVQHSLIMLSKTFQVKILKQITENEANQLSSLQLTSLDLEMIQQLTATHVGAPGQGCANTCPACKPVQPEKIPLLPPCKVTIGAFRSLLIHRPKLHEMATREFCLYRYNREELLTLDASIRGKGRPGRRRKTNFSLNVPVGGAGSSQSQPGNTSEVDISQDESDAGGRSESEVQRSNPSGKRKDSNPTVFHITSVDTGAAGKSKKRKARSLPSLELNQGGLKAYSRGKSLKSEPQDNYRYMPNIKLEVNGQELHPIEEIILPTRTLPTEEEEARNASDQLLFQRMLSIFYWPAMMTLALPPQDLIHRINSKVDSIDVLQQPLKTDDTRSNASKLLTKDELDIEEQVEYIKYLNKIEVDHQEKKKQSKIIKELEEQESLTTSDTSKSKNSVELTNETLQEDNIKTDNTADNEDARQEQPTVSKKPDGRHQNRGLASHSRKKNLKSLRRSLVMKKIWDARRKGCYPQRTTDRGKRRYTPRGSRTRDCVRKDILIPAKSPRPWDFPLDGPLKVQPQVPFVASEEMLSHAFSENPNNKNCHPHPIYIPINLESDKEQPPSVEVTSHVAKKIQTRVVKRKGQRLVAQEQLEAPIKIQGHSTHASSPRKLVNSGAKVLHTTVEVHANMAGESELNLKPKDTSASGTPVLVGSTNTKSQQLRGSRRPYKTQSKSQMVPLMETIKKEIPVRKVYRPSHRKSFEASFQNLLEDPTEEVQQNVGEESTFIDPKEATLINEASIPNIPIKQVPQPPSRKRSYQVSFQSLLDDPVEVQENVGDKSMSSVEVGSESASYSLARIQPLIQSPVRRSQRKPLGGQSPFPSSTSLEVSQVIPTLKMDLHDPANVSQKKQLKEKVSSLMASDKQLRIQPQVLLHQLPTKMVQPLNDDQTLSTEEVSHCKSSKTQFPVKKSNQNLRESNAGQSSVLKRKQTIDVEAKSLSQKTKKQKSVSDETQ